MDLLSGEDIGLRVTASPTPRQRRSPHTAVTSEASRYVALLCSKNSSLGVVALMDSVQS
ncbi:MAG: hypothetical protein M3308_05785 [Actinomycetota bacterium]|nr:hypothetical protein [Actinomycetota bacterium]